MTAVDQGTGSELLSIGRFARLTGLSIGALRHYDEPREAAATIADPEDRQLIEQDLASITT